MIVFYVLDDDNKPIALDLDEPGTLERIAEHLNAGRSRIANSWLGGGWRCSTVFLTVDHNHSGEGPPIVFETMILSPGFRDLDCKRYATIEKARLGHKNLLNRYQFKGRVLKKKLAQRERRWELTFKRFKDRGPARNHGRLAWR